MNIYLKVNENQRTEDSTERWNSFDKRMILKKCWVSLVNNLSQEDSIYIYYSNTKDSTIEWMQQTCPILHNFIETESDIESNMLALSDIKEYSKIEQDNRKLVAFLEDDYLWLPNAMKVIKEASNYWKGFILANDSPNNYTSHIKSLVFVGPDRHWKTNAFVNWNLIGSTFIFNTHIDIIENALKTKDLRLLQNLLKKTDVISPITALATHCMDNDMSPLIDWNYIWNGINI